MSSNDESAAMTATVPGVNVHRARLLETITSIGKVIAVSRSLQAVMDAVAEECARLTRADGATIFMVEGNRLSAKAAIGILGFAMLDVPIGNNSLPSNAVKCKHVIRCADASNDDRTLRRVSSRTGTKSSVSAPFYFDVRQPVAGVLHVASTSKDAFTDEDEEIIHIFANVVGSAIQNARQYDQALRESREDALTGLLNRRTFEEHVRILQKEQINHMQPYSLILFDIDRLKYINDQYGHVNGDHALQAVASAAKRQIRQSDIVYRLGGDEFAVLMPQTRLSVARVVAERIEQETARNSVRDFHLSVSSGACEANRDEHLSLLLARTDTLLYEAKHARYAKVGMRSHPYRHGHNHNHP